MFRDNFKSLKEKELRKLWKEYQNLWEVARKKENGHLVEVEPYQKGWVRYYVLRGDIKNRNDARFIQQALDLINVERYCSRQNFTVKDYKTGKYVPMEQKIGYITEQKYETLSQNVKKWFTKTQMVEKYSNRVFYGYVFKLDYFFEFKIEPNIITHHWIPDNAWETRRAEINHKFQTQNLWPKINKMLGASTSHKDWKLPRHVKNKRGHYFSLDEFED
jgi:hypothetical protein